MELSELHISQVLTEEILLKRIPVIRLREKSYSEAFADIDALLSEHDGVVVMGYSPRHDYIALEGGDVLENPRVYFINIPIPPRKMEEKLQQIVAQIGS